ncbi:hypothetical protein EU77_00700 [Mesotoga sp. SC_NapDC]|nr:hypothetical protein EU77_00700 [Mesotoga sp. SC_NapDC]
MLLDFYITTQSGGSFAGEVVVNNGIFGSLSGIVQPDGNVLITVAVENSPDHSMSFYGALSNNNRMGGNLTIFER